MARVGEPVQCSFVLCPAVTPPQVEDCRTQALSPKQCPKCKASRLSTFPSPRIHPRQLTRRGQKKWSRSNLSRIQIGVRDAGSPREISCLSRRCRAWKPLHSRETWPARFPDSVGWRSWRSARCPSVESDLLCARSATGARCIRGNYSHDLGAACPALTGSSEDIGVVVGSGLQLVVATAVGRSSAWTNRPSSFA